MCYKRLHEIDAPKMMAAIIAETLGKSREYYRDRVLAFDTSYETTRADLKDMSVSG